VDDIHGPFVKIWRSIIAYRTSDQCRR